MRRLCRIFQFGSIIDPVRLDIFHLFGGSGILAYFLAMIVIPDEYSAPNYDRDDITYTKNDKTILWGALLVFVGLILFFMHNDLLHLIWVRFWDSGINLFLAVLDFGIWGVFALYKTL
jgi:hypothetical protein